MGSILLKVHFCLEFSFWLKLAAKNETHQALQNNVNRIITLSHARIHSHTHRQTALWHIVPANWLIILTHKHINTHLRVTNLHIHTHILTRLMMVLNVSHTRPRFPHLSLLLRLLVYVCAYKSLCVRACQFLCVFVLEFLILWGPQHNTRRKRRTNPAKCYIMY